MLLDAQKWLNSKRDYTEGLALLKVAGMSDFMLELLESGPDHYNTTVLLGEIKKLAIAKPDPKPVNQEHSPVTSISEGNIPGNDLEKKIRIDQTIRQLFKEICHLHGQLSILPEGDRLHAVSTEILLKDLKKQRLFDELHYFKTNGHWFDELPENQPKPEDLEQEIKNAMANRSKVKKYLKSPLPAAKKEYYQAKITEWTKRIDNLKSKRNAG